jgi:ParB family transcriptional regulator, chromosome partitioning protein
MSEQRRLGRGLEALLSQSYQPVGPQIHEANDAGEQHGGAGGAQNHHGDQQFDDPMPFGAELAAGTVDTSHDGGIVYIPVHDISPNRYQPRQDFDETELDELAESIRQHGVIQPIVVRRVEEGRIELISGERRLRAAIKAGWAEMPTWIRQADDRQVAEIAIVENVQRKDLNPLEKAQSFHNYIETYGCTQDELAARVQVNRSTVSNLIRLLELPREVQGHIRTGSLSQGHARALLPLGDEQEQINLCRRILTEQLNVRAVEEIVTQVINRLDGPHDHGCTLWPGNTAEAIDSAQHNFGEGNDGASDESASSEGASNTGDDGMPNNEAGPRKKKTVRPPSRSGYLATLEQELRTALGTKVEIKEAGKRRGRGQIIVHFQTPQEFERLQRYLLDAAAAPAQSDAG